ncbi:hypothetical protein ACQP1P_38475 [Dactylosporangium sp. CA-052675]|uniref:hypothetical protein n=1 Tax=Dactylosporangium sp. CA-052675 TaxID=3239927 RepID=UPI003D8A1D39
MQTITRPTPHQLADAITDMVLLYAESNRELMSAREAALRARGEAEAAAAARIGRCRRAVDRRFRAIQRLTEALRQRADA